jgi:hypothetical protein
VREGQYLCGTVMAATDEPPWAASDNA